MAAGGTPVGRVEQRTTTGQRHDVVHGVGVASTARQAQLTVGMLGQPPSALPPSLAAPLPVVAPHHQPPERTMPGLSAPAQNSTTDSSSGVTCRSSTTSRFFLP
jgi:hypothetical protein